MLVRIGAAADVADGQMRVFDVAGTAVSLLRGKQALRENVTYRRVRELRVVTPGLGVQLDGEYCGETPVRFSVESRAVEVLLPRGKGEQLFSDARTS